MTYYDFWTLEEDDMIYKDLFTLEEDELSYDDESFERLLDTCHDF